MAGEDLDGLLFGASDSELETWDCGGIRSSEWRRPRGGEDFGAVKVSERQRCQNDEI